MAAEAKKGRHPEWSREIVVQMHRRYIQGATLRELGSEYGITYERVRQLFQAYHLPTKKHKRQTLASYEQQYEAWSRKEEIRELYKELGTVEAVAREVGLPRSYVAPVLSGMQLRQLYRRRGQSPAYDESFILGCLRKAAEYCRGCGGEGTVVHQDDDQTFRVKCDRCEGSGKGSLSDPLTIPAYRKVAPKHGFPADLTVIRAFGSWQRACEVAGVKANPAEGPRRNAITADQCIQALRLCSADIGRIPSYELYSEWAREHKMPSGPTVRVKVGPWSEALLLAFGEQEA